MYCGTDIIEVSRIKDSIINNNKFINKIYSKKEIEEISNISSDYKYQRYAGRFAAKEAIFKAISEIIIKNNVTIDFKDIEILNDDDLKKRPYVNILKEDVKDILKGYNIDVSLSHVKDNAIAMCIVVKLD